MPRDPGPFDFEFLSAFGVPLRRLDSGETLFLEGDDGRLMYLVVKGRVDIKVGGAIVENVGVNDMLGEMALIDGEPRSATAVANGPTELAEVDRDTFLALVSEYPSFALYVMKLMAARIRRMNALS